MPDELSFFFVSDASLGNHGVLERCPMSSLFEPGGQLLGSLEGFAQRPQLRRDGFKGLSWSTPEDDQAKETDR